MPDNTPTIEPVEIETPQIQEIAEQTTPEEPSEIDVLKKQIEDLQNELNEAKSTAAKQKEMDSLMTLKLQEAAEKAAQTQPAKPIKWVR